jgi:hypothetical protein
MLLIRRRDKMSQARQAEQSVKAGLAEKVNGMPDRAGPRQRRHRTCRHRIRVRG